MKVWKVYFKLGGEHLHCRVFTNGASCGELTVRRGEEFASFLRAFSGAEFFGEGVGITAACNLDPEVNP